MSEKTKKNSNKKKSTRSSGANSPEKSKKTVKSDCKKIKEKTAKKFHAIIKKIAKWIKPPAVKANIIISFAIIILITLCIIFFRHAFRHVSYIVRVNDKIYEQYIKKVLDRVMENWDSTDSCQKAKITYEIENICAEELDERERRRK